MADLRAAAQQALEALTPWADSDHTEQHAAYHALCAQLAQAEPVQPVAFVNAAHLQGLTLGLYGHAEIYADDSVGRIPLYTAPPQREPLTVDEIWNLPSMRGWHAGDHDALVRVIRAVERAHGIKGKT